MAPVPLSLAIGLLASWGLPAPAQAKKPLWTEGRRGNHLRGGLEASTFTKLMDIVSPAVVNITAARPDKSTSRSQQEEMFGRNVGTGFLVRADGLVITNFHVIESATDIRVRTQDGRDLLARPIGWDRRTDLALLRVDAKGAFPIVPLGDSDKVATGQWVVAIGNPLGLEHTMTAGIVSAKQRRGLPVEELLYQDFIQTDASINPGNSGGPLVNLRGEVIGIATAVNRAAQGIGFAIPINMAKELLPQLYADGRVRRAWMGIEIDPRDLSENLARAFSLKTREGALINSVEKGSPAAAAGLKPGDVVVKFDGRRIHRASDLPWIVSVSRVGRKVPVVTMRDGSRRKLTVVLGEMSEPDEAPPQKAPRRKYAIGLQVAELNKTLAKDLGLTGVQGVIVTRVDPGSAAERAGVISGDVIVEVNGRRTGSVDQYFYSLKPIKVGDMLRMLVRRHDGQFWLAFPKG